MRFIGATDPNVPAWKRWAIISGVLLGGFGLIAISAHINQKKSRL